MKKKLLLLMGIFSLGMLNAQMSINTQTPQGIFHIDALDNTSGTTNTKDDVIIASDGNTGVNVAIGGLPVKGASISLHSINKGFLPNRVALVSTMDVVTVPSPVTGMVVYNTQAAGIYPYNTLPGYYLYTGYKWERLRTNAYLGVSETRTLKTAATSTSTTDSGVGTTLDFGNLTIFEDGAYAFSFNVYATSSTTAIPDAIKRGILYIYVLKKSEGQSSFSNYKTIEVNPSLFPNGQSFTITAIAGMELKSQDQLMFTTKHYSTYPSITYTADRSYMVFWKL